MIIGFVVAFHRSFQHQRQYCRHFYQCPSWLATHMPCSAPNTQATVVYNLLMSADSQSSEFDCFGAESVSKVDWRRRGRCFLSNGLLQCHWRYQGTCCDHPKVASLYTHPRTRSPPISTACYFLVALAWRRHLCCHLVPPSCGSRSSIRGFRTGAQVWAKPLDSRIKAALSTPPNYCSPARADAPWRSRP